MNQATTRPIGGSHHRRLSAEQRQTVGLMADQIDWLRARSGDLTAVLEFAEWTGDDGEHDAVRQLVFAAGHRDHPAHDYVAEYLSELLSLVRPMVAASGRRLGVDLQSHTTGGLIVSSWLGLWLCRHFVADLPSSASIFYSTMTWAIDAERPLARLPIELLTMPSTPSQLLTPSQHATIERVFSMLEDPQAPPVDLDGVARRIEVEPAVLRQQFGDMDNLAIALLSVIGEAEEVAQLGGGGSDLEQLLQTLDWYEQFCETYIGATEFLAPSPAAERSADDPRHQLCATIISNRIVRTARQLDRVRDEGMLRSNVSTTANALTYQGLLWGLATTECYLRDEFQAAPLLRAFLNNLLR